MICCTFLYLVLYSSCIVCCKFWAKLFLSSLICVVDDFNFFIVCWCLFSCVFFIIFIVVLMFHRWSILGVYFVVEISFSMYSFFFSLQDIFLNWCRSSYSLSSPTYVFGFPVISCSIIFFRFLCFERTPSQTISSLVKNTSLSNPRLPLVSNANVLEEVLVEAQIIWLQKLYWDLSKVWIFFLFSPPPSLFLSACVFIVLSSFLSLEEMVFSVGKDLLITPASSVVLFHDLPFYIWGILCALKSFCISGMLVYSAGVGACV